MPKNVTNVNGSSNVSSSSNQPIINSGPVSRVADVRMPSQGIGQTRAQILQVNQSQIRHQSCPALNHSQALHNMAPKSCPTSQSVSPNSSQQLLLPLNTSSSTPAVVKSHPSVPGLSSSNSSSNSGKSALFQQVPRHSLHPQCSGKERTPSSSFSTRVVVSGKKPASTPVPGNSSGDAAMVPPTRTNPGSTASSLQNPKLELPVKVIVPSVASSSSSSSVHSSVPPPNKRPDVEVEGPNYENTVEIGRGLRNREQYDMRAKMRDIVENGGDENTTSYENLNMDYIARLTTEGFSQDLVIRALGITRNDIEMARDILNEFGTRASS